MWTTSAEFDRLVRRSHRAPVRAGVWDLTSELAALRPIGGQVEADARRAIRRTCTVTLVDPDGTLTPADATDLLAPYGNELRLWRGVTLADGTDEMVPLGVLVIVDVDVADTDEGVVIELVGEDRSRRVARNRWVDPYVIAKNTNVGTAVATLIGNRWPDATVELPPVTDTTPKVVLDAGPESDPWQDALDLAASVGWDLYADVDGVFRARTVPDPAVDLPVATYQDGDEAVLLDVSRRLTAEGIHNGVIASGEGTGNTVPVRAEAWDDNTASPTYRFGPFGQVPRFYTSPLLTTQAQAQSAADSLLLKSLGSTQPVEWSQVVNPAHDVYDVVRVVRDGARLDATLVLDQLTVPLTVDEAMSAQTRLTIDSSGG